MKFTFLTLLVLVMLLGSASVARAELQCWSSANGPSITVQNANQCTSYNSNALLFDTSTQTWSHPGTGQQTLTPFISPATSQADCGPNETFYPNTSDTGAGGGTCQPNNAPSVTQSITNNQQQATPANSNAFCKDGICTYTPLEPLPGYTNSPTGGIAGYLQVVFRVLLSLGGLFAVTMLVISGIRYMLSESFTDKDKAKKRISSALWGLLLLASSWLILYVINPQLLNFSLPGIKPSQTIGNSRTSAPSHTQNTQQTITTNDKNKADCENSPRGGGVYTPGPNGTHTCTFTPGGGGTGGGWR